MPDEVIVSVDESSDNTRELVRNYATSASFDLILIDHRRSGISSNYFNALDNITGDVVIVADHDDIWLANKTEEIATIFREDSSVSIISSDSKIVDKFLNDTGATLRGGNTKSARISKKVNKNDFLEFLVGVRMDAHTLAFRSHVKSQLKPIDKSAIREFWFEEKIAIASMSIGKLVFIPEALTLYRQHAKQHIGNKQLGVSDHLKPRKAGRIEKLNLLGQLIRTNQDHRLVEGSIWIERLGLLNEYLDFYESRNSKIRRFQFFLQMSNALIRGKYKRFTRRGFLSYLKDMLLRVRT